MNLYVWQKPLCRCALHLCPVRVWPGCRSLCLWSRPSSHNFSLASQQTDKYGNHLPPWVLMMWRLCIPLCLHTLQAHSEHIWRENNIEAAPECNYCMHRSGCFLTLFDAFHTEFYGSIFLWKLRSKYCLVSSCTGQSQSVIVAHFNW